MNLCEAGIGEQSAAFMRPPGCSAVRTSRVRRKIIHVAVAAGTENDGVGDMRFDAAGVKIARYNAASFAVDHDEVQHFRAREHGHRTGTDLAFEGLIRAKQKLLASLAPSVERARNLGTPKGPVVEHPAVFARERNALRHALIDNVDADLREAVDVGFSRAKIAAFHGVVKKAIYAITIIAVILGGIDSALRGNAVSAARRILETETLDVVAEFRKTRGRRRAGETGADDEDVVLALVGWIHQLHLEARAVPKLFNRTGRSSRIERHRLSHHARHYRYWNRNKTNYDDDAEDLREPLVPVGITGMIQAKRLKHALKAVIQMQTEESDRDDVENRNRNYTETANHIGVDIAFL